MKINHLTTIPENYMPPEQSRKERTAQRLLNNPDPRVRSRIRDYRLGDDDAALKALTMLAMAADPGCSFSEMEKEIEARLNNER